MSDQTVLLPKWSTPRGNILAKGQLGYFHTFWTMPVMIFSPVANFGGHPLVRTIIHAIKVIDKIIYLFHNAVGLFLCFEIKNNVVNPSKERFLFVVHHEPVWTSQLHLEWKILEDQKFHNLLWFAFLQYLCANEDQISGVSEYLLAFHLKL